MAVSIANTLTSRLWKGEPKVVIRGKFVLGLASSNDSASAKAYFAPSLYLKHLAYAPLGKTFSLQVLGRYVYSGSQAGPVYDSISYIGGYEDYAYTQPELFPASPYAFGEDGPFFAPRVDCGHNLSARAFDKNANGEGNAYNDCSSLGQLVASDLRIVLRGSLSSLDVTGICAVGFLPNGVQTGGGYSFVTVPWYDQRYYSGTGFSPEGVGWRPTDVHIYDNPGLRGYVTAGNVPVIWE